LAESDASFRTINVLFCSSLSTNAPTWRKGQPVVRQVSPPSFSKKLDTTSPVLSSNLQIAFVLKAVGGIEKKEVPVT